tara:strand:+ start:719 stop:1021 length:303 start_codon:yes stop_codon:yes gene_type:complete
LKLSEVAVLLGVPHRKIQYLRERGIVIPSQGAGGRGRAGLYTPEDIRKLRLALDLRGLEESIVRQIVQDVAWDQGSHVHNLSRSTDVVINLSCHSGETCS